MAIRFRVSDVQVECDEASEAAELLRSLTTAPASSAKRHTAKSPMDSDDSAKDEAGLRKMMEGLPESPRKVLKLLRERPNGIVTGEVAKSLEIEEDQVKYLIRSIRSAAEKNGLKPDEVLQTTKEMDGTSRVSRYKMAQSMRERIAAVA